MLNSIDADRAFMKRTLKVLREYDGRHESTNVINCLLGLLIVPEDVMFTGIPDEPLSELRGWGIGPDSVKRFNDVWYAPAGDGAAAMGGNGNGHHAPMPTLRDVVKALRTAVAGFGLKPRHTPGGKLVGFEFRDGGLHVVLSTADARSFVEKLADHVAVQGHFGPYGAVVGARYIASGQREPFHRPDCRLVRRIRRANLQGIRTREAALEAGHRPCRTCKP